jgi:hypothetical protein
MSMRGSAPQDVGMPSPSRPMPIPVSPRGRDRGMSDPEAMVVRPAMSVRSGRSLYTAGGGAPPESTSPRAELSTSPHGAMANRNVMSAAALGGAPPEADAGAFLQPRRGDSVPASVKSTDAALRPVESLAALQSRYGLNASPVDALLSAMVERKYVRCTARNSSASFKFGSMRGTLLMLFDDVLLFGDAAIDVRALVLSECVVTPCPGELAVRIGNGSPDGDVRIQFETEGDRVVWTQTLTFACNAAREREPPDPSTLGQRTKKNRSLRSKLKGGGSAGDLLGTLTPEWKATLEQCRESIGQSSRPWHLVLVARLHALCLAYAPA